MIYCIQDVDQTVPQGSMTDIAVGIHTEDCLGPFYSDALPKIGASISYVYPKFSLEYNYTLMHRDKITSQATRLLV